MQIAVVIPIYKNNFSKSEMISLQQVENILSQYDIYFIAPRRLNIENYKKIHVIHYDDDWFKSVRSYSKLMLQPFFYEDFLAYDYMLIYQLDAFVFEDKLQYFASLNYDYIGAPWPYNGIFVKNEKEYIWHVGNGGFSLRKVNSFYKWLNENDLTGYIDIVNEDLLIASLGSDNLEIAPVDVAEEFSLEMNVEKELVKRGDYIFGCHGWNSIEINAWRTKIQQIDNDIVSSEVNKTPNYEILLQRKLFFENKFSPLLFGKIIKEFCSDGPYFVWGTGEFGLITVETMDICKMSDIMCVDSNPARWGTRILNGYVEKPNITVMRGRLIIAIEKSESIENELLANGYEKSDYITWNQILSKIN